MWIALAIVAAASPEGSGGLAIQLLYAGAASMAIGIGLLLWRAAIWIGSLPVF